MASAWHQSGLKDLLNGSMDIDTDTFKLIPVDSTYTDDKDYVFLDEGDGDDVSSHEISATSYTGGFGGAGRKSCTITLQANNTDDRVDIAIADITWSSIGGASNATIGGFILAKEITNDAGSKILAFFDITDTATNGGDITVDFTALASGGNLRIAC
jgi:hypothetical protein